MAMCRRLKPDHYLIPSTKRNSKCGKDLNVIPKTTECLENTGRTLTSVLVIFFQSISSDKGNKIKKQMRLLTKKLLCSEGNYQ